MAIQIADLHCDLLCYLHGEAHRTAYDARVRCSIPQLRAGGVVFQTMAVFTDTVTGSSQAGWQQVLLFLELLKKYPENFTLYNPSEGLKWLQEQGVIRIALAVENASSIWSEEDSWEQGLKRLKMIEGKGGKIIYISLTWNNENRFGGGAHTKIGLKEDGEKLLEILNQRNIALDISHASDRLVEEIFEYKARKHLPLAILASHSNCRTIANVPRNLPDDFIRELIKEKGVIGFNLVRPFVGEKDPLFFVKQLEHFIKLGAQNHLCFGADFFYENDVPPPFRKTGEEYFFPKFQDASCYGELCKLWRIHVDLSEEAFEGISHLNLLRFISKNN